MNISVDAVLTQPELKLGFGSRFEDLYDRAGLQRLDAVSADLPAASGQFKQTLQRLNRLIAGQQQEIQTTVENLRAVSENFKEITDNAKKYPAQALFGAPPPPSKVMGR